MFVRKLAKRLAKYPKIKSVIKRIYQYLAYALFSYKNNDFTLSQKVRFTNGQKETFFGYYDKSPINADNNYVLFHSTDLDTSKRPKGNELIDVNVYDLERNLIVNTLQTNAWNWQQGARLQWLTNGLFGFNYFDEKKNKFISKVYNIKQDIEVKVFEYPIQDAFKDCFFLSLNYTRLNTLRPDYGYRNLPNLTVDELSEYDNDGIWYVDFETGAGRLLISLDKIIKFKTERRFKEGRHYVNHIMIAPDGKKFIFLHRCFIKGVRYDRLILSDLDGNLTLLNNNKMISHYYWWGNDKVFGYMNGKDGVAGYYIIDYEKGVMTKYEDEILQRFGDGHPNIRGDLFITDTYPDKSRMQSLIYGNLNDKQHLILSRLKCSLRYDNESRCDLHPRFSQDGNRVFFDTVNSGKRLLCMINVQNISV